MSRKRLAILSIALLAVLLMAGCAKINSAKLKLALTGDYVTYISDRVVDCDGIRCDAEVYANETLGFSGMDIKALMKLHFNFVGDLPFPSQTLIYDVQIKGDWTLDGDTLRIWPDPHTFKAEYVSSSAEGAVQQAMVRHLRKHVRENIEKSIVEKITREAEVKMDIMAVMESGIVGSNDGHIIVMTRSEKY